MRIYIDSDFKIHTLPDEGLRSVDVEIDSFKGKCAEFIEGYRYVPEGERWVREDGVGFAGEMLSPWKDYAILQAIQKAYEATAERDALLEDLASLIDEVYQSDLEMMEE